MTLEILLQMYCKCQLEKKFNLGAVFKLVFWKTKEKHSVIVEDFLFYFLRNFLLSIAESVSLGRGHPIVQPGTNPENQPAPPPPFFSPLPLTCIWFFKGSMGCVGDIISQVFQVCSFLGCWNRNPSYTHPPFPSTLGEGSFRTEPQLTNLKPA